MSEPLSKCHNAPLTIGGDDHEGTHYYVCSTCNDMCDLAVDKATNKKYQPRRSVETLGLAGSGDDSVTLTHQSQAEGELRAKVIKAVCFKPNITGHLEQFEAIEALIQTEAASRVQKVLSELHRKLPQKDTHKHAMEGPDEWIQVGFNGCCERVLDVLDVEISKWKDVKNDL